MAVHVLTVWSRTRQLAIALAVLVGYRGEAQVHCIHCIPQNEPLDTISPNLVQNGGFELNNCTGFGIGYFAPASGSYSCDIDGWICTGGGINTYAQIVDAAFSAVPEGSDAAYFGNSFCEACSNTVNDTTCFLGSSCELTGIPAGFPNNQSGGYGDTVGISLSQTISGLAPGQLYRLEFWAGGEDFGFFVNPGLFALDIGFGRVFLRTDGTSPNEVGRRYEVVFEADSPDHTITFTNWGHVSSNATELILDDVRLTPAAPQACSLGIPHTTGSSNDVSVGLAGSRIEITGPGVSGVTQITLYDVSGRCVLLRIGSEALSFDISHLVTGPLVYDVGLASGARLTGHLVLP